MILFITLVTTIVSFFLGLFVLRKNDKSATNIYFAFLIFCIGLYSIFNYLSLNSKVDVQAFYWAKLLLFVTIPQGVLFYFFVNTFPTTKFFFNKKLQIILILWAIVNLALSSVNLIFKDVTIINGQPKIETGPFVISFGLLQFGTILAGCYSILNKFIHAKGLLKKQLEYIAYGILLSFGLTLISTLILPLVLNNSVLIPISPVYLLIAAIATTYSIVKHRLLDIRMVVVRSVSYLLLIGLLGIGYTIALFVINIYVNQREVEISEVVTPILLTLFIVISFQPLQRFIERITDKFFYKDHYDANTFLWDLSRIMASSVQLSDLSKQIIVKLRTEMKITYGEVVLIRHSSIIWVGGSGKKSDAPFKGTDIAYLIREAHSKRTGEEQLLIYEELSSETKLKNTMREHNITLVLPLVVKDELIGGILLGEKSSGEIYSSEDIDVLKILGPEVAIAIKNALSFEEIKRFNVTLEEEIKRATHRLRNANTKLKELDTLKDEFVSIASHELRTPMTAIKSYLWMALNQPGQDIKEPLKKYLNISYNSTERLIRLVNDMLTVSRIERNKIELKTAEVDVFEIAKAVYDELKITADERKIHFTIHKAEEVPYIVNGDREKLREVFQNIVGNALKFTSADGKIKIEVTKDKDTVSTAISDTGPGIAKESIGDLFKKFSKIEYSYAKHSNQPGTGLGLYISKQIISLHKGDIKVESKVDVGTTFTVVLPTNGHGEGAEK